MKLFSLPDNTIDQNDRAQWVTPPFDKDLTREVIAPGRRVKGKLASRPRIVVNQDASVPVRGN